MSAALEKPAPIVPEPLPVQRMGPSEIEENVDWIAARLQKGNEIIRLSAATPQAVRGWLRGCMTSNDMWLVASGRAVALAKLVREPLKAPRVEEVFVLAKAPEAASDASGLYVAMAQWAENLGCARMEVSNFSDVPLKEIERRVGRLRQRQINMVVF